jgi:hypothetical protein
MAVLAYFSYGICRISVFSLKNCGITILEILRYTVFAILDSKTAVIDKICLRYYGIEYPPNAPLTMQNRLKLDVLNFFQGPVTLLRMRETYKAYEN